MHEYGKPEEESSLVTDPMSLSDKKNFELDTTCSYKVHSF